MEPEFQIKGENEILKDITINVEMLNDEAVTLETLYYKGKQYEINNQDVLRYHFYISYKDSLFYLIETDNLHGKIKGIPVNYISFKNEDNILLTNYEPMKQENSKINYIPMIASQEFFKDRQNSDKEKFISIYRK